MATDTHTDTEIQPMSPEAAEMAFRAALAMDMCRPVGQIDRHVDSLDLDDPDLVLLVPAAGWSGVAQYVTPKGLLVLVGLVGGPWACLAADGASAFVRMNRHLP